jgi:hypothetical protein
MVARELGRKLELGCGLGAEVVARAASGLNYGRHPAIIGLLGMVSGGLAARAGVHGGALGEFGSGGVCAGAEPESSLLAGKVAAGHNASPDASAG